MIRRIACKRRFSRFTPIACAAACILSSLSASVLGGCPGPLNQFIDLDPIPSGNEVELPTPNVPPKADAGSDLVVRPGETVFLDGSRSTDADGDNLRLFWTQIEGDLVVNLAGVFSSVASFETPANLSTPQTLTFRITVIDREVATTDEVTVTIEP